MRERLENHDEHTESNGFLTETQMQQFERNNLTTALEKASWKIKGRGGAAELLGLKPATLVSRIKKLGLKAPAR
jgi:transcriptional regulator with GAF, ATPase, and Fis domain